MSEDRAIHVSFKSRYSYLPLVRSVVRGISSHKTADIQQLEDIELSVHEALSNIIRHGYEEEPNHLIEMSVGLSDHDIWIRIRDSGHVTIAPLNPVLVIPQHFDLESLSESGRGLFLIYQLMDEVSYSSQNGENILQLRKRV